MYSYSHDPETGGLLLNDNTQYISNEPRPVYTQELDMLGIDRYWNYERQTDIPYMWAESNNYIYRGKKIFKTKGGSLYEKPEIEIQYDNGSPVLKLNSNLEPVDIEKMNRKNEVLLNAIRQITVKKIENTYKKYKNRLDCFHVAFSGGKDSIVLLDLVKKALPKSSFIVIFGDTKMEFPDTYKTVDRIEEECRQEDIDFYRASSHLDPEKSWRMFGPPSRVLRWCCTVHKSAPQILKLREILKKNDYVGMDFVGVRAAESDRRSEYDEEAFGKKQKGQHAHYPILQWTSAEIWLYIYANNLIINDAYKKGNARVGCIFCPMAGGKSYYVQYTCYKQEIEKLINVVKTTIDDTDINSYLINGGYNSRRSGQDILDNETKYQESIKDGQCIITVKNPSSNWNEWEKTILHKQFIYNKEITENGFQIKIKDDDNNYKLLKQVLKKTAYCIGCKTCEANCRTGALQFNNSLNITNCINCESCLQLKDGCFIADSKKIPMKEKKMPHINCFDSHVPKREWIQDFFNKKEKFMNDNGLGPNQMKIFKRFISHASWFDPKSKQLTDIAIKLSKSSWENEILWGISLIELYYNNPQIAWYVDNLKLNKIYSKTEIKDMINGGGKNDPDFVSSAYKNLCLLPLGTTLHFGKTENKGTTYTSAIRTKCRVTDDRVVLYSLYKYAEECGNYYEFTLSTLLDSTIQSKGVSPVKLFGLEADEMEAILRGLSVKYDDFINVSFTHDLDKIVLRDYHTSQDVLGLF